MSVSMSPQPNPENEFISPSLLLAAIVASSEDAIVSKNLNSIVTSWNEGAERLFGYPPEEMIGQSILKVIPPERHHEEAIILEKLRAGLRIEHYETQRVRKDGTLIDVSLTISPVKNEEGKTVGASKIVRDISERKKAQATSAAYQNKLEVLAQIGSMLAAERDLDRLVQAVTDAGRELTEAAFGAFFYNRQGDSGEAYTLYTLSGAPREAFESFGHPRATPIFKPTFEGSSIVRLDDVTADERYGQMPPHHGMPKGHLPVRSYLAVPVISREGRVLGGLFFGHPEPAVFKPEAEILLTTLAAQAAVAIDNADLYSKLEWELNEQRNLQAALKENQELNTNILGTTTDCVKILDIEGVIVMMNEPGSAALGLGSPQEVVGKHWSDLFPAEEKAGVKKAIAEACEGSTSRFEGWCDTAGGGVKWWDSILSPIRDAQGTVTRLAVISRDITNARRAVAQIEAAKEEAERQSRIKDEFLATLSHELRTPLQSILGWTQMLSAPGVEQEEIAHGLEVIDRNARSQTRIIEDLLDMSRILAGKVRLDVHRITVAPLITAAIETVQPAADAKGIRITSVLDSEAQPISGDPNRLQQIFWNLLSNAIKFSQRGGRVHVVLERVNSHVEVSVTDKGEGIASDFLPHVFERFRQADGSTTRTSGGLGLGLAIVKNLVELHGGSVRAKSSGKGKGATFIVALPLAPLDADAHDPLRRHPAAPETVSRPPEMPDLSGVKVLLVDDEKDALELLGLVLKKAGATIQSARSADEALREIASSTPDLVVSDIGMPEKDGLSLIRSIRALEDPIARNIPAIALSAYTRAEDRIQSISAGFHIHLSKPADPLELLTVIKSIAKRQAPLA